MKGVNASPRAMASLHPRLKYKMLMGDRAKCNLKIPTSPPNVSSRLQWTYDKLLALESVLRQSLTDMESQILEAKLPVTVEVDQNGEELPVAHRRP